MFAAERAGTARGRCSRRRRAALAAAVALDDELLELLPQPAASAQTLAINAKGAAARKHDTLPQDSSSLSGWANVAVDSVDCVRPVGLAGSVMKLCSGALSTRVGLDGLVAFALIVVI